MPNKRSSPSYRIPQANWDQFISEFNGLDCDQMCDKTFPTKKTVNLFQNPHASMVYCRWCDRD